MLCRQRPDLSDLSIRTQEGILVKNSKNISIKELIASTSNNGTISGRSFKFGYILYA